jgi:hypothetical protein
MSIAEVRHLPKVSGILLVTDKEFFSDIYGIMLFLEKKEFDK